MFGGAVHVTGPAARRPFASRAWLAQAATAGAVRSALWLRQAVSRRGIVTVVAVAALVGAAAGGRDARSRPVATIQPVSMTDYATEQSGAATARSPGVPPRVAAAVDVPPFIADSALAGLERPGYLLSAATVQALQNV